MKQKKIACLISSVIVFIAIVSIYSLMPYIKKRQDTIDIILTGIISSTVYYFVAYFLLRVLENRKINRK
jgi:phosphotransferase system  glucose/maltose/N-acetylglucosamine-specific IIC component